MIIDQSQFDQHNIAKLVKGTVVPRPIAWISSISKGGIRNLAPFSFFTVASLDPVQFCISISPGIDSNKSGEKDTLANIRVTGEFVINMVSEDQANQMHDSSKNYEHGVDEFNHAGIKSKESEIVQPPCVANAPVNMECELKRVIPMGRNHLVLGELVCYHIRDAVYMEGDKVDPHKLKPVGRMAGDYTFVRNFFSLPNPDL
ncbi:MAG TPA: flavin reductase family protein [Balneolaceae bacterium]|nr:flavin reductase family protein [Balneolaceae bacterium]